MCTQRVALISWFHFERVFVVKDLDGGIFSLFSSQEAFNVLNASCELNKDDKKSK